jgi:ABC-type glycerol-3-phosphate transport system substrate-binding protein
MIFIWELPGLSGADREALKVKGAQGKKLWCTVLLGLATWALVTPSKGHGFSNSKVALTVEADDTAATAAIEESAKDFTRETGIEVVVEKFGYALSSKKAAEDLDTKAAHYDVVIQNADGLPKFAADRSICCSPLVRLARLSFSRSYG